MDRRSGVSQRLPISTLENVLSSAEQRAVRSRDSAVVARVADVYAAIPAMTGKFELEYEGEMRGAENIARELIRAAVGKTFTQYFANVNFQPVVQWFEMGGELKVAGARLEQRSAGATEEDSRTVRAPRDAGRALEGRCGDSNQRRGIYPGRSVGAQAHQPKRGARILRRSAQDARAARPARAVGTNAATAVQLRLQSRAKARTMKYTRYSRYSPDAADDIDLQELMNRMSDFFLQSGFEDQYGIYEMDMERSREQHMEQLRQAILRALQEGDLVPPEMMEQMLQNPDLSQNKELRGFDRPDHPAHGGGRLHHAAADRAGDASAFGNSGRPNRPRSAERGGAI